LVTDPLYLRREILRALAVQGFLGSYGESVGLVQNHATMPWFVANLMANALDSRIPVGDPDQPPAIGELLGA
jgi:hypothetical protein